MTNLIETLKTGVHAVKHTKKDGTIATRMATLDPSLIPTFEAKTDRITPTAEHIIKVWDVGSQKWVSLIADKAEIVQVGSALANV